ncbi:hypothetical protein HPULCUR_007374 [Helicostylum pulchrum]|uniref:Transmembrane protein n=1 Tax=Helicostylum pulchrum TaxID=562976 RepID=A0ABP9Y4K7_9FUNG
MFPVLLYRELPDSTIAPVAVAAIVVTSVLCSLVNTPAMRNPVSFSALVAAISQLICTILVLIDLKATITWAQITTPLFYSLKPFYHLFYAIYVSFMFVPSLIGFARAAKKTNRTPYILISYFGYAWTAVIIVVGLTLMILILTKLPEDSVKFPEGDTGALFRESVSKQLDVLNTLYSFIYFANWGLVVTCLTQHILQFNVMKGKARGTLIVHSALNIIAVTFNTAFHNTSKDANILAVIAIIFVFVNITSAAAIIIAVQNGYLWDSRRYIRGEDEENIVAQVAVTPRPAFMRAAVVECATVVEHAAALVPAAAVVSTSELIPPPRVPRVLIDTPVALPPAEGELTAPAAVPPPGSTHVGAGVYTPLEIVRTNS